MGLSMDEQKQTDVTPKCANGHPLTSGQRYCPECGLEIRMDTLRNPSLSASSSENGLPLDTVPKKDTHYRNNLGEWVPVAPSAASTPPRPKAHVKFAIIAVAVAALAAVGLVVALSLHHSSESISYKDGYSAGKQMAQQQISAAASNPAADACDVSATLPSYNGGPPSGDNTSQWTSGCIAGYNASNYDADHPGATNNSGDSGN
jgi:hypothetical protein